MIKGINHITFSVANLARSVEFYTDVLGLRPVALGNRLAYFDVGGLWLALNEEPDAPRHLVDPTYTHIAFSVAEENFDAMLSRFAGANVMILEGRPRHPDEGRSAYFVDPDGHRLELHSGSLESRLNHYARARPDVRILEMA